jgi:hypothetical protein
VIRTPWPPCSRYLTTADPSEYEPTDPSSSLHIHFREEEEEESEVEEGNDYDDCIEDLLDRFPLCPEIRPVPKLWLSSIGDAVTLQVVLSVNGANPWAYNLP